jgi:uncharacterized phosphatase
VKHLYFVRHGESELGALGLGAGHSETPLTKEGRLQAKLAGKYAKKLAIDHVVSSPLSRALDTAKIIAKEMGYPEDKIEVNPLFIERYFGVNEGQPIIIDPDFDFDTIKGIEKTKDLIIRGRKALDYLESLPEDNILVVAHGQLGRAIRHHILEDFPFDYAHKLRNAEIVQWV